MKFDLLKKVKPAEGSLIKKIDKVREANTSSISRYEEKIENIKEELSKKFEEMLESKTQLIEANAEAIKSIQTQLNKIDKIISTKDKGIEEFKEKLNKIDETVLELLSLYEVVSNTVNPFVGESNNQVTQKLAILEKKVDELSKTQAKDSLAEDIENRFKALEESITELKKVVESNSIDKEALIKEVKESIFENMEGKNMNSEEKEKTATLISQKEENSSQKEELKNKKVAKLEHLDNRPETSIILLNWIEFLMEKVGRNNLIDVLEYYVDIGWISEEVCSKMMTYASGIDYYVEKPTWKLLPEDHTKSLLFIEQLRGKKIDKNMLMRVERNVDKVIRSSEVLML